MGGDKPALPGPTPTIGTVAERPQTGPVPEMKVVEEPSLSEQMGNDEVPFNDSLDPNVPVDKAPKVSPPPPKPTAQKPRMTKKGVQKIAGGRGR